MMIQLDDVGRGDEANKYLFELTWAPHVCACYNKVCEFIDRSEHILLYLSTPFRFLSVFYECVKSKLKTMFTKALGAFKTITERNAKKSKEKFKWS